MNRQNYKKYSLRPVFILAVAGLVGCSLSEDPELHSRTVDAFLNGSIEYCEPDGMIHDVKTFKQYEQLHQIFDNLPQETFLALQEKKIMVCNFESKSTLSPRFYAVSGGHNIDLHHQSNATPDDLKSAANTIRTLAPNIEKYESGELSLYRYSTSSVPRRGGDGSGGYAVGAGGR